MSNIIVFYLIRPGGDIRSLVSAIQRISALVKDSGTSKMPEQSRK